ncbi:hypothetical protein Tco_1333295 [Tanacetum coccineum]
MSSHGWGKEKEASTHDWGRMSHHDTGTRVEKGVPAGRCKTPSEGKKTLGSSFEATSRAPVNVSRKLKNNGMPLTAQVADRALGTKNGTTQKMITIKADTGSPRSIGQAMKMTYPNLGNYSQQNKYIKDPVEIHHIKQREGEPTEAFMERFKAESMHVSGAPECMRISGFMHGSRCQPIKEKVSTAWKHHETSYRPHFDKRPDFKSQHKSSRRHDRFTPLTKTPKEILAMETVKFKAPPMTRPAENRNKNKFYEFHGDKGHNKNECIHLRK